MSVFDRGLWSIKEDEFCVFDASNRQGPYCNSSC